MVVPTTKVAHEVVDESDHPSEDEPNEVKTLCQALVDGWDASNTSTWAEKD